MTEQDPETRIRDLRAQLNAQADQIERLSETVKVLGTWVMENDTDLRYVTISPEHTSDELRALFGIT